MISIVIICEKPKERDKIYRLLSIHTDFRIVAFGKDGYDALQFAESLMPDVLIMDLYLSDICAPRLAPILKRKSPATALMALSDLDQNHQVAKVINAEIAAYLLKQEDMDKLAECVRLVNNGGFYISAPVIRRIFKSVSVLQYFPGQSEDFSAFLHKNNPARSVFTPSEQRIIVLMIQGLDDGEIADRLLLKRGTIRNCFCSINRKAGTKNRIQIVVYALVHGIISFEQMSVFRTQSWFPGNFSGQ